MFISKFCAFNYRSLRETVVRFEKGKNVIVGKNNSGKSNIIKGLEILIGEKFPTYQNITDNDFYTFEKIDTETGEVSEEISQDLYLEVTLSGTDFNASLIASIKKKTAFSKISSQSELYTRNEEGNIVVNFDFFQNLDDLESRKEIATLDQYSGGRIKKTDWKDASQLASFLSSCKKIKVFFCKSRFDDEKAGFGLLCYNDDGIWITHFLSKKLRDSLITTTVVGANRSHKEDLRLTYYTWFGKLIASLWETNKVKASGFNEKTFEEEIIDTSSKTKLLVDRLFQSDTDEIRKLLEGAIAHKTVSFKLMNDNVNELYKNVQIFVNDGIDRPIYEKGTGIQSAVIISLFSLYCSNFHKGSSLLIAEEPELYLHPQARRVISAELNKFIAFENQERQIIISTHSAEYLKNVDPYNIIRVYKDYGRNCSLVAQLDAQISEITPELKRFIWSNNTEIFFADKVVLVEGGEVYLIPALVDKIIHTNQYLDYQNISVARVNGKGSFLTYIKMLKAFHIQHYILGDLDCFKDEVVKIVRHLELTELIDPTTRIKTIISGMAVNYSAIKDRAEKPTKNIDAQKLKLVFERFADGSIEQTDADLLEIINQMKSQYIQGDKIAVINREFGEDNFIKLITELKKINIFIWSKGELENYYTEKSIQLRGSKDVKALEISYLLSENSLEDFFVGTDEIYDLVTFITNVRTRLLDRENTKLQLDPVTVETLLTSTQEQINNDTLTS